MTGPSNILNISEVRKGWEFINMFYDSNKHIYYCRIRKHFPGPVLEVTGSGYTMAYALWNANVDAKALDPSP